MPNNDIITEFKGMKILIRNPSKSQIGKSIYKYGYWEQETTNEVLNKVKKKMCILDVGADIGYYTLLFSKLVGTHGSVYSFEPIPEAKEYLDVNIILNKVKNVKTFDYALFDQEGFSYIEDPFGKSRLNENPDINNYKSIKVHTKKFDALNISNRIDLIKIDVEGSEMNVLNGMAETIKIHHPIILLELHCELIKDNSHLPEDVIKYLNNENYTINPVDQQTINYESGNITIICT
tara:strand:- start:2537 stop:3241 length:705 start_codon:yes stop_codon:yes gene_type:complete